MSRFFMSRFISLSLPLLLLASFAGITPVSACPDLSGNFLCQKGISNFNVKTVRTAGVPHFWVYQFSDAQTHKINTVPVKGKFTPLHKPGMIEARQKATCEGSSLKMILEGKFPQFPYQLFRFESTLRSESKGEIIWVNVKSTMGKGIRKLTDIKCKKK